MNLPLDSQYFSFSGSQSEIQVVFRSLIERLSFLNDAPLVPCRCRPKEKPPPEALESLVQGGGVADRSISDLRAVNADGRIAALHYKLRANSSGETKDLSYKQISYGSGWHMARAR